ncbi:hypothetical protein FJN13_18310 [Alteromonas mediterranea]|uniref:hypothetical protein n=1 Tax=Alteromonas mediterranea TaxID=314275 RepID=UPI0011328BD7|nr:hypothetical protein [Alteromonas mediterranea]QDG36649.1 hypothetical protein FJN13_18310 [Alteromonas mediterranea]
MFKPLLIILLGVSITGYFFLSNYIRTKYRVPKLQGHHLLYRSVLTGTILFTISAFIFAVTWKITQRSSILYDSATFIFNDLSYANFKIYLILFNSFLFGWVASHILNFKIRANYWIKVNNKHLKKIKEKIKDTTTDNTLSTQEKESFDREELIPPEETDPRCIISHYLLEEDNQQHATAIKSVAFDRPRPLLISLSNNRCYVGILSEIRMPKESSLIDGISVYPLCSGYRDKETLCLKLTTFYTESVVVFSETKASVHDLSDIQKMELINTVENYRISFSFSDIVSLAMFDLKKYDEFKNQEDTILNPKIPEYDADIIEGEALG